MRISGAALAVICALACAPAHAADFKQVGPLAASTSLIAAHKSVQEPAFEFVYKIEGDRDADTITFDIAADVTTVLQGRRISIFDYALRRLIDLDDAAHKFHNDSWYGAVDFWIQETANRRFQRSVLKAAGTEQAGVFDPFWVQSELHIVDARDGTPEIDTRTDSDGTAHFRHAGAEVASFKPSKNTLSADEARRFKRFLLSYTTLHPLIVAGIAARGVLPERLSYVVQAGGKTAISVWTLQSFARVKAAYPLASSARPPVPDHTGMPEPAAGLLGIIGAAIGGEAPGKRSAQEFETLIGKALAAHRPFEAVLLALERDGRYGAEAGACGHCHPTKDVVAAAKDDPRMAVLRASLKPERDKLEEAITALKAMKRDDLSNATMLDDYLGNLLVQAGRGDEGMALIATALRADPYMPSFYHDMGNACRAGGGAMLAWVFYDLGRTLPGGDAALSDITDYETRMATDHPELF